MPEKAKTTGTIKDDDWDKPMTCPIDPKELAECEACQQQQQNSSLTDVGLLLYNSLSFQTARRKRKRKCNVM